jgi:exonuclease SbcC
MKIAKDNDVKAILHPGDFFTDSDKKLGNEFVAKIAQRWLSCGIPLIGIAGNHDLIGNNIDSLPSTTAGLLDSLGVFKLIKNGETLSFTDDVTTVHITGSNYHKNMDKAECINDYIVNNKTADVHIHIVHGMLTEKSYGKLFRHTTIDQIANTQADITFCGHDHVGFGIVNYKNKWFVNPGAIVRMTGAENELTRTVKVVLVTIDNGNITLKEIPLASARPSNEVVDRSHLDEVKVREEYEDYIKDGVRKLKLGDSLSITEVLENIYNRDEIPENIRKSITDSITSKTIDLNSNKKIAPTGTKIVHVKIHNFQSHEDSEYDLSDSFNVIVGESKQGKSASLRAIRWVVENKPAGKGLIRSGSTEAFVELTLQNGTIIRRFISTKENGYKVFYPDGTISEGNTRMMSTIQDLIGWCNMRVGENEELPLNHLKQGDSWYLNGDKYSSADRARILGAINKTESADATIKEIEKENGRINEAIKHETVEIAVLANEIEEANKEREILVKCREMIRLKMLTQKIKKYQELKRQYDEACQTVDDINKQFNEQLIVGQIAVIKDKIKEFERGISYYAKMITETNNINTITPIIQIYTGFIDASIEKHNDIVNMFNKYDRLTSICKQRENAQKMISYATKQATAYEAVINLPVQELREKMSHRDLIADQCQKLAAWTGCLERAEVFLKLSENIDGFAELKERLNSMIEKYNRVQSVINNYKKNIVIYNNDVQAYEIADKEYQDALNKKIELLNASHVCPTCYSAIDEDTVKKIIENQ